MYPCKYCLVKKQCYNACEKLQDIKIPRFQEVKVCLYCGNSNLKVCVIVKKCYECNTIIVMEMVHCPTQVYKERFYYD
jgi:hypothetical protein